MNNAMRIILLMAALVLSACGERASTWDDKSGHYISTDEYKQRQRERLAGEIDEAVSRALARRDAEQSGRQ